MTIEVLDRLRQFYQDQDITFEALLHAFAVEQLLSALWEVDENGNLVLRNDRIASSPDVKQKLENKMQFYYIGSEELNTYSFSKFFENFMLQAKMLEISIDLSDLCVIALGEDISEDGNSENDPEKEILQVTFSVDVDSMYIPMVWEIVSTKREIFPRITEKKSFFYPEKTISYFRPGPEEAAVEHIIEILEKLELLNELNHYLDLYRLLGSEALSGSRSLKLLISRCEEKKLELDKERMMLWWGYRNYGYMKKRWKVFLRRNKLKEPSWESCMDRIGNFCLPIWKAMVKDAVFFGDWMPGLARYLD